VNRKSQIHDSAAATSDVALILRSRQGDTAAFPVLVERYYGLVYTIGYSGLRCHDAAEDLTQEVFLRLYLNLHQLTQPQYFSTWATRVARNLTSDWMRNSRRASRLLKMVSMEDDDMQEVPTPEPDPRKICEAEELNQRVRKIIDSLPSAEREVLFLYFSESLTQQQIGAQLEMHHTTVGRLLKKGVDSIRTRITDWPPTSIPLVPPDGRKRGIARATAIIAATTQLSLEAKQALAAAATTSAHLAQPATGAAPAISSAVTSLTKGAFMITKTHKAVAGLTAAIALTAGYHVTHPGEFKQMLASVFDRSSTDHTYVSSIADYIPPVQPGEEIYHGAIGPVDSCVLHIIPNKEGSFSTSFDVPKMGLCHYPMITTGQPDTGMRLVASGQIELEVTRRGREIFGEATYAYKGADFTTSPVHLVQVDAPLPIKRQMPIAIKPEPGLETDLTGTYATGSEQSIVVSRKDGQLYAQKDGEDPLPIYPMDRDRYFFKIKPAEISFRRGHDGKVNRMIFRQEGRNLPGRKVAS